MRHHYEKPAVYMFMYGLTYTCDHPVYPKYTLYKTGNKGLAVIQQLPKARRKTCFDRRDI